MKEHFIENGIEYILAQDGMYYPNLQFLEETDTRPIGIYGDIRLNYLIEHKRSYYIQLFIFGKLHSHLADIDEQANSLMEILTKQMAENQGITEHLKSTDQLAWIQAMNNIYQNAKEIIYHDIIFI